MTTRVHRSLSGGASLSRRICTAAADRSPQPNTTTAPPLPPLLPLPVPLHRRLLAIPVTGDTVVQTLNEYIREGRVINKVELQRCISVLRTRRRYRHALQIMEWMELRNVNLSHKDLAIRLDLIAKTQGIVAAEKYFNDLASLGKNRFTYGALLNCYCQEKMEEKALSLFQQMEESGIITTLAFNNLLSLYMKLGQPEKVPGLVKEMREKNIPFATFTYNLVMHSYGCVGDIEGMERVYEEMVRENEDLCDWTTYSNLAVEYSKAGLRDKAESALKRLEEKMGPRNRAAHRFLISLYANISDLVEVHRIWNLLKSDFPVTFNLDYIVVLQALEKLNDIDGFSKLYSEWELNFTNFDARLTNVAIRFYLGRDMTGEAESALNEAIKKSNGPLFTSWELFIEFFLRKQNMGDALKYLETAISKVKDNEWKPKAGYIEKLLEHFEEERDVDAVEELYKLLKRSNCLDSRVYLSLFRICVSAGRMVDDIHKRMEDDGIEMNCELKNLLQGVCLK